MNEQKKTVNLNLVGIDGNALIAGYCEVRDGDDE